MGRERKRVEGKGLEDSLFPFFGWVESEGREGRRDSLSL
jgi:hypothetical protein